MSKILRAMLSLAVIGAGFAAAPSFAQAPGDSPPPPPPAHWAPSPEEKAMHEKMEMDMKAVMADHARLKGNMDSKLDTDLTALEQDHMQMMQHHHMEHKMMHHHANGGGMMPSNEENPLPDNTQHPTGNQQPTTPAPVDSSSPATSPMNGQ